MRRLRLDPGVGHSIPIGRNRGRRGGASAWRRIRRRSEGEHSSLSGNPRIAGWHRPIETSRTGSRSGGCSLVLLGLTFFSKIWSKFTFGQVATCAESYHSEKLLIGGFSFPVIFSSLLSIALSGQQLFHDLQDQRDAILFWIWICIHLQCITNTASAWSKS